MSAVAFCVMTTTPAAIGSVRVCAGTRVTPDERLEAPEEVASAILWLLSREASFTTGSFIDVTGGR